jgi:hypothetical protein
MFGPIGDEYPTFLPPVLRFMPGKFPVGAGQWLLADRKARLSWHRWRKVRHGGVVTGNGMLVEAMPSGAREVPLTEQRWTPDYVYIRPEYQTADPTFALDMPGHPYAVGQAELVADAARGYIGTPYNFLTYGSLAATKLRFMLTRALLRKMISTRKDMMCSQLVDQCLADAGFHVFDDGRLPQDVVPAELFRALLDLPGQWCIPHRTGWLDNSLWHTS